MKRLALCIGVLAVVSGLCGAVAHAQPDPRLDPTYGSKKLKTGFLPDPFKKEVVAGGPIKTNLGNVNAYVAKAPDFRLEFKAGNLPLTFYVKCDKDTTLLINLPDGTWIADDDSGGNLNPLIRLANPKSGIYDIYVGSYKEGENPKAMLHITELEVKKVK
ncbi:MAG TPA: hypothetical protein VFE62_04160 [Gemmataceae bacterium]|nr:hypothetical protein [Gemmataceae bacterium]